MNGIELMLMSLTALWNVTGPEGNGAGFENLFDADITPENFKVSLADVHLESIDNTIPPEARRVYVATLESPPYSSTREENGVLVGTGYAFEVFNLIAEKLNLTYELVPRTDKGLGNLNRGIIKLFHDGKIDMAVAFLPILYSYGSFIWYSPIIDDAEISVLMKRPKDSATGSGLLAPFDNTVWICIVLSLAAIGPVVYLFTSFRSYLWNRTKEDKFSITSCIWFTYGALLKQGSSITPVNNSTRLVFATWWIFITILTSFYTANLTAFLTLSQFTLPYKSVDDIVNKRVDWITATDRTLDNILATGHGDLVQELESSMRRMRTNPFKAFSENDFSKEILDHVTKNQLFLGEKDVIRKIIYDDYRQKTINQQEESTRCFYVRMPEYLYSIPRAFMHRKDSVIRQAFDKKLQTLIEVGIIRHLETMNLPSVEYCPLNLKSTDRQLKNSDLLLTYKVIGSGFTAACFIFICELIRRRTKLCLCCRKDCLCCCTRVTTPRATPPIVSGAAQNGVLPSRLNKNLYTRSGDNVVRVHNAFNQSGLPGNSGNHYTTHFGKVSPIYESVYGDGATAKKTYINGRDYWLITQPQGDKRLIPIRTPSALLFQYTS